MKFMNDEPSNDGHWTITLAKYFNNSKNHVVHYNTDLFILSTPKGVSLLITQTELLRGVCCDRNILPSKRVCTVKLTR